jgi:hypothetical protein
MGVKNIFKEKQQEDIISSWLERKDKPQKTLFEKMKIAIIGGVSVISVGILGYSMFSCCSDEEYCQCDDFIYV